jgi:hypothetical protein
MTTVEAAKAVGISRRSLQKWIKWGWFDEAPAVGLRDGHSVRIWTSRDVTRLRNYAKQNMRKWRKNNGK